MTSHPEAPKFSDEFQIWLKSNQPKTVEGLTKTFADKSFATIILFLMLPSALPIPTGGITNLLEIITMILAIEMVIGLRAVWLPKFMTQKKLDKLVHGRGATLMMQRVRWFEEKSNQRAKWIFNLPLMQRLIGLFLLIAALGAFFAVPFSGLDTLPSIGAVIISLSLIFEDILMLLVGMVVTAIGIGLIFAVGSGAFTVLTRLF